GEARRGSGAEASPARSRGPRIGAWQDVGRAKRLAAARRARMADDRVRTGRLTMVDEKIQVRVTATGQTLDVVVFNKRLDTITVVLGEGVHNVRVDLTPTRN